MLRLVGVSLYRGGRCLFAGVDLLVHAGQKVGIIGSNGSGKSSLMSLILGELAPDGGELTLPSGAVIAHVAQETRPLETPAIEYVIDGDRELRRVEAELAQAAAQHDGTKEAALHARLEAIGAYSARARAARLMRGLGFLPEQDQVPVRALSGGWRVRLSLARALMCRSNLLLLDEPTNHLDLDAVIWLQDWLRAYPGTLLLISHDRDFLDEVVGQILHLDGQNLRLYGGNYSQFEACHAAELASQRAAYERQQREVAHIEGFVQRFRAKATKARQAQSRLKALARLERIAPAHVDSPFHFAFPQPERVPSPLLDLRAASVGYGEREVLRSVRLRLGPGDRIGLLGANGAGKSTLIRLLAGELPSVAGAREEAQGLRVGYFAQHQLEQLDPQASPFVHLRRLDSEAPEQALRDFLGGFGFGGEMAFGTVASFSGGEKSRLVLALLVYQRPNLLLLDEPTNHLDLEMRHALSLALQEFEGAMVLVSHDRHLLRTTVDQFLLVSEGGVEPFEGDLEDYRRWLAERRGPSSAPVDEAMAPHCASARKDRRREEAELRRRLQPLRREIERWEASLAELGARKLLLEERLTDTALYHDDAKAQLREILFEQARVTQDLAEAEVAWLHACERLEAAGQAD